ncbi:MAG TPA: hypothetical protein VNS32_12940, partial [Flavisolibacter sp.]|nr:hypothetical protein [Flavisolibacter sp.]
DMLREISSKQGLKASSLLDLYRDREGNLWMASDGNGVIKMKGTDVQLVTGFFADTTSYISAMLQAADTFWFFNATANMVHRVYHNKITSFSLGKNRMRVDYMYISNKHLYLCSAREMICIRDKDERSAYLRPRFVLKSDVHFLTIGYGIKDPNGCIILSLQRDLNSYVSVLKNDTIIMEYPLAIISDQMTIDHKGNLWIVSRDNHVMVFSLRKDQPAQYLQLLHDYQKGLPVTSPRSIALDQLGNVWVGTRYHGVFQFRNKNDKLIQVAQYTTHNGLTDNFAYFLHCGDSNTIWVGTQTGLDKIFLKKGKFIIGNVSKNNNFFQSIRRVFTDNDHSVWALTGEGSVIKIAGSAYFPTPPAPALLLSSVLVNNKTYDGPLDKFSHDQNNFTFS